MNFIDKKQPPSRVAVISTEGLKPLVLSSFLPDAMRELNSKAKIYLFTGKEAAQHLSFFHYDEVLSLSQNKAQNTALLLFHSKIKKITHFIDLDEGGTCCHGFSDSILRLRNLNVDKISDPEKYLVMLSEMDLKPQKLNFKLNIKSDVYSRVSHELLDNGFDLGKVCIFAPEGEGFVHKTWTQFEAVARDLIKKNQRAVILPGEVTLEIASKLKDEFPKQVWLWNQSRGFEETAALISRAGSFYGADNLWSYLASQLDVPTQVMYGPSLAPSSDFLKIRKNLKINEAHLPCSPCQRGYGIFDFNCTDNVCMKVHLR